MGFPPALNTPSTNASHAFHLVPIEFNTRGILAAVVRFAERVKRGAATPYLKKWQDEVRIEVVREGRRGRADVYRRVADR